MKHVVLIRHGESQWNLENRFTGWVDVPLSLKGEQEAREAGEKVRAFRFDHAFTSVLTRAIRTLEIVLDVIGQPGLPVEQDQALNERMYGELQGLNKTETVEKYGEAQVKLWRRSYDIRPPGGESLQDTAERVLPYYRERVWPRLGEGRNAPGRGAREQPARLSHAPRRAFPRRSARTEYPHRRPVAV